MSNRKLEQRLASWTVKRELAEKKIQEYRDLITRRNASEDQERTDHEERERLRTFKQDHPYFFKCANCQTASPRGTTSMTAWHMAANEGWIIDGQVRKLCARCAKLQPEKHRPILSPR